MAPEPGAVKLTTPPCTGSLTLLVTVATSGATFLSGSQWGAWNGALLVAELKGEGVLVFSVSAKNKLTKLAEIVTDHGRIRSVHQGPDGALYFTTSNGTNDGIYRLVLN